MRDFGIELYERWAAIWNRELPVEDVMAPEFTLRYAQPGASVYDDIHDPAAFAEQIELFHKQIPGLVFAPQGVPVIDMDETGTGLVAQPYGVTITRPGEKVVELSGTDILRAENGRIVEVWSVSGGLGGRSFYA
ncbi:nuclear transport factor 2 family protein [Nocardia sp. CDC153]|uniref:nuclear transport factor 2 family protein n=1 Tax=Nocardia sp. CDC153 TaxID=3112167 RepID=UPI002DB8ED1E|nr:nuclear transport factor 2 family protein [Nocardia sp. CDC153]MEC3956015.1 nuclear transport factor 2 family protein [Nocardia sp. CDC153]